MQLRTITRLLFLSLDMHKARRIMVVMAESIELLVASALQLPPNQRLELAGRILSSMELSSSSAADAAWDKEIRAA